MKPPRLLYGTAWKEGDTERLVGLAVKAGFRGIDTANQRKHYFEEAVGAALKSAFKTGLVERDALFLQTKFTHLGGQDHRLPYDANAPVGRQVEQSFASSLQHLGVDQLDSYVLHGPSVALGWADEDWEAWATMEDLQRAGRTKHLGVSNVSADQLEELHQRATVKPAFVQNRCFTRPHADFAVREYCTANSISYQGFSLLTGHRALMQSPAVQAMAKRLEATLAQVVFAYCLARGILVLTGTTSSVHMAQDLEAERIQLTPAEMAAIDRILGWA
ncbi:MAG: aldo/keto reductase [Candidatus Thermoplasmatota archaeon]|jgi:diketogulonate reductase-like aldo/keto reductase